MPLARRVHIQAAAHPVMQPGSTVMRGSGSGSLHSRRARHRHDRQLYANPTEPKVRASRVVLILSIARSGNIPYFCAIAAPLGAE